MVRAKDVSCICGKLKKISEKVEVSMRPDGSVGKSKTTLYKTKNCICWIGGKGPQQVRDFKLTEIKVVK